LYLKHIHNRYTGNVSLFLSDNLLLPFYHDGQGELWFEAFKTDLLLRAIFHFPGSTVNSMWIDADRWEVMGPYLKEYHVVLLPFHPVNRGRDYWESLAELQNFADYYQIPHHQRIIDICIYPYISAPNQLPQYIDRVKKIRQLGYRTVAGIDNYIYKSENHLDLLEELVGSLQNAGLTYALTELEIGRFVWRSGDSQT
jgi:hypothetical protein